MASKVILLYINSLALGGAQRVTCNLSAYLAERGYSVFLACRDSPSQDFYPTPRNVVRITIGKWKESNWVTRKFLVLRDIFALRKVLRKNNVDVAIGMMTEPSLTLLLASLKLKTKIILSERNHPPYENPSFIWRGLRRYLYRYADSSVTLTQSTATWVMKNTKLKKVNVIPVSIDWPLLSFDPFVDPNLFFDPKKQYFLSVGRLDDQKGFDNLIKIFSTIAGKIPNWDLIIAGEGKERENLEQLVLENGLEGRIKLPGRVGNILDWYKMCDIFVFSSRFEGFGNVLLEAMSAGCPVISFDCEVGPSEIIEDGHNGILVDNQSYKAMAIAMESLAGNQSLKQKYGQNATEVREIYSNKNVLNKWVSVIEQCDQ
ncbi:glycosyltransferase family 4 protein [uncultured Imperialibacter sp.]|uniref:glycosyltransferase family 4 protein n=1 Tax=uncultured Imperialibacter sp. TaxID=1672639 RepID=UPI0030D94EC8|tara:strand:+ start:123282 stop:124400 length:1119 start_codon:yes stop_codon:yes gene_type:complete